MDVIQGQSSSKRTKQTYCRLDGQKLPYTFTYEEALKDLTDASLAYYNSKHDHRFELVEYLYLNSVKGLMDPASGYEHLSFIAKTVDPPHQLRLFFAEVHSVRCTDTYQHYVKCCTPVDPDTPFFTLGCGSCHPRGVIYHPLGGFDVGRAYASSPPLPSLRPAEKSAKELLREKYTFNSSNQDLPPDEDKDFRKIVDGYAREALIDKGFAVKLVKVVKAVRFIDFEPRCLEDGVAWVHMLFLAKDAFCDARELFFAEFNIDCRWASTCVRMTETDLGSKAETSCTLCRESCPMFHPEGEYYARINGEYYAGIGGGTLVDALNEQRSWRVRVYLEEKQPDVATQPGLYPQNGLDEVQTADPGEENMSMDLEDDEENTADKVVHSKRHNNKRSRPIDEIKVILEKVTIELHQLRQTMDPLAFARQLREAVMGVEGFSHRYLNTAFKLLMKQEAEAKVFLVTDGEGKRDILIELSSQIEDI